MYSSIDFPSTRLAVAPLLAALIAEPELEARRVTYAAGDEIHSDTASAKNVYLIHRGQVRLYQTSDNSSARLLEILGRDEWFGVGALAETSTYGCRAVAVAPSVVSEIDVERLKPHLASHADVLLELTRDMARRLLAARDDASRMTFDDCNSRLIRTLLRFSQSAASTPREDGVVLHITHSQLAQAVGAARETISLALTDLRRKNLLRTGRNQLFFNPDDLRRMNGANESAEQLV